MAAVRARQELEDGIGFPVAPHAEHDALVAPLHRQTSSSILKFESYQAA
jgi:hypothetical protein